MIRGLFLLLLTTLSAFAQSAAPSRTVEVSAEKVWTDSGIDLQPGDRCAISAEGAVTFAGQAASPDGLARGWRDVIRALPLNSAGRGALLARVGNDAAPRLVGSKGELVATISGRLWLGINQAANEPGRGSYKVQVQVTRAVAAGGRPEAGVTTAVVVATDSTSPPLPKEGKDGARTAGAALAETAAPAAGSVTGTILPLPKEGKDATPARPKAGAPGTPDGAPAAPAAQATPAAAAAVGVAKFELAGATQLLAKLPRRIADNAGNAGDMVNFLVIGSGDQLLEAFRAAGWVVTDRTKRDAVLHGLLSTLSKQAYVELPMSELYLFGRAQDYGLAHADPLQVVSSRHHLRLWKAPAELLGPGIHADELWVGAATHDIGFDRDQRNNGVTHKIDPNVDEEREFVRTSLLATGLISSESALLPADPVREARTATGGSFHSDGRVFVFQLTPRAVREFKAAQ